MAEPVTVYKVYKPWGDQDRVRLAKVTGTARATTVRLDHRHQAFDHRASVPLSDVDTDPAAAVARFVAAQREQARSLREQADECERLAGLAEKLEVRRG